MFRAEIDFNVKIIQKRPKPFEGISDCFLRGYNFRCQTNESDCESAIVHLGYWTAFYKILKFTSISHWFLLQHFYKFTCNILTLTTWFKCCLKKSFFLYWNASTPYASGFVNFFSSISYQKILSSLWINYLDGLSWRNLHLNMYIESQKIVVLVGPSTLVLCFLMLDLNDFFVFMKICVDR